MVLRHSVTAVAAVLLLAAGCGQSSPPVPARGQADAPAAAPAAPAELAQTNDAAAQVLVTVNGEPITAGMFAIYYNERLQKTQGAQNTPQAQNQAINEMINLMLLAQAARQQGMDKRPDVSTAMKLQEDQLLSRLALQEYSNTHMPSEEQIKESYEARYVNQPQEEYKARHILVKDEAAAKKLIEEIKGGADFATLAKEHSEDPAGKGGGDLGWFDASQMVGPFSEAVQAMEPGSISQAPVQTQFGWHVIQLEEKRKKTPPALDDVKPQLEMQIQRTALMAYVNGMREQAKVEVNEGMVKKEEAAPAKAD